MVTRRSFKSQYFIRYFLMHLILRNNDYAKCIYSTNSHNYSHNFFVCEFFEDQNMFEKPLFCPMPIKIFLTALINLVSHLKTILHCSQEG